MRGEVGDYQKKKKKNHRIAKQNQRSSPAVQPPS